MVDITQPSFWSDFSRLNDATYGGDGVNRARYRYDEDGFKLGTEAALLTARQQLQEAAKTIHQDLVEIAHPVDFDVRRDGVPIDKADFDK